MKPTEERKDNMAICAQRIRELRENTKRSRKVTSELCGLTSTAFSRYERGERIPDADSLCKMAGYFGVTMDYLWGKE